MFLFIGPVMNGSSETVGEAEGDAEGDAVGNRSKPPGAREGDLDHVGCAVGRLGYIDGLEVDG
jgi:hypothetical protein